MSLQAIKPEIINCWWQKEWKERVNGRFSQHGGEIQIVQITKQWMDGDSFLSILNTQKHEIS